MTTSTTARGLVWPLIGASLLSVLLATPTLKWMFNAWSQSPLDRQGPIWLILAVLLITLAFKRHAEPKTPVGIALLLTGVVLSLLGLLVDIHFTRAVALILMLTGIGALAGLRLQDLALFALILGFAMPTSAFILGNMLQAITPASLMIPLTLGIVAKWPLGLAGWWLTGKQFRSGMGLLLLVLPLTWAALKTGAFLPEPGWLRGTLGPAVPACIINALLALGAGLLIRKLTCRKANA